MSKVFNHRRTTITVPYHGRTSHFSRDAWHRNCRLAIVAAEPIIAGVPMTDVTDIAPSSLYKANRLNGPVNDVSASVAPESVTPEDASLTLKTLTAHGTLFKCLIFT